MQQACRRAFGAAVRYRLARPICLPYLFQNHPCSSFSTANTPRFPPVDDGAGQPSLNIYDRGVHDVGGMESLLGQTVDLSDPSLQAWEQETHALLIALAKAGCLSTDELRRNIEAMSADHYIARSYYCKWATSIAIGLLERNVISYTELDQQLLGCAKTTKEPSFPVGQRVKVRSEQSMGRWRKPHLRTPGYIFGVSGVVDSYEGNFPDPGYKAFRSFLVGAGGGDENEGTEEPRQHLYRVRFSVEDIFPEGKGLSSSESKDSSDTVTVEIYENWLMPAHHEAGPSWEMDPETIIQDSNSPTSSGSHHHNHHHGHSHAHDLHDHDHEHLPRSELEQRAIDLEQSSTKLCSSGSIDSQTQPTTIVGDRLSSALIDILSQPDRLGPSLKTELRQIIDSMESIKTRADGATLVVRAWTDPAFEERLLEDAASAALEMGINTINATAPTKLKVVKSTLPTDTEKGIHNLVVCTLCSCYPLSLLGLSPKWYKSRVYRARAVREPRAMLRDSFGVELSPEQWSIRVHDSTADLRYLVLPPRPLGTENWTEDALRQMITRDTMIGVALPNGIQTKG